MSFDNDFEEHSVTDARYKTLLANADAARAARQAGYKSPLRRLLGRLRPRRQELVGDPRSDYGTGYGPGH